MRPLPSWRTLVSTLTLVSLSTPTLVLALTLVSTLVSVSVPVSAQGQSVRQGVVALPPEKVAIAINATIDSPLGLMARRFAPHLARHLPGAPRAVVRAHAGDGGWRLITTIEQAREGDQGNRWTLAILGGAPIELALGLRREDRLDGWHLVGAWGSNAALVARRGKGLERAKDLFTKRGRKLRLAGSSPGSLDVLPTRALLEANGVAYGFVAVPPGGEAALEALFRDDADIAVIPAAMFARFRARIELNGARALVQYGRLAPEGGEYLADAAIPAPLLADVWRGWSPASFDGAGGKVARSLIAARSMAAWFVAPPTAPADVVRAWRRAFAQAAQDARYMAEALDKGETPARMLLPAQARRLMDRAKALASDADARRALVGTRAALNPS